MKQLTMNGTTWGFVEVPEGAESFWIGDFTGNLNFFSEGRRIIPHSIMIPPGHWSDPIKASEVTEEWMLNNFPKKKDPFSDAFFYIDYNKDYPRWLSDYKEAIYSLIRSLGMEPNRTVIVKGIKQNS